MKRNVKLYAATLPLLLFTAGVFTVKLNPGKIGEAAFFGYILCMAGILLGICFFAVWTVLSKEKK